MHTNTDLKPTSRAWVCNPANTLLRVWSTCLQLVMVTALLTPVAQAACDGLSGVVNGNNIEYTFKGSLDQAFGSIPAGTPFTGKLVYPQQAPNVISPANPMLRAYGQYVYQSLSITLAGTTLSDNGTGTMIVRREDPTRAMVDELSVYTPSVINVNGYAVSRISLSLKDANYTKWSHLTLPDDSLTMNSATGINSGISISDAATGASASGHLDLCDATNPELPPLSLCDCVPHSLSGIKVSSTLNGDTPGGLAQLTDGITNAVTPFNGFAASNVFSGTLSFDLGDAYDVDQFDIWNGGDLGTGVDQFDLEFYDTSNQLLSRTSLRIKVSVKNRFKFAQVKQVRYVKMVIRTVSGSKATIKIPEVAFYGVNTRCTPKPTSAYHAESNILSLPVVNVGGEFYNAKLKMVMADAKPSFVLQSAIPIATPRALKLPVYLTPLATVGHPNFDYFSGQLSIPFMYVETAFSVAERNAKLTLIPGSNPYTFTLDDSVADLCAR